MGQYEKAMKYVKKELELTDDDYIWGYFYLGLFQRVSGDDEASVTSLMKAVEIMKQSKISVQSGIRDTINTMKSNDQSNEEYYSNFLRLITI